MEEFWRMRAASIFDVIVTTVGARERIGLGVAVVGLVISLAASVGAGQVLSAALPSGDGQRDLGALFIVVPIVIAVTGLATFALRGVPTAQTRS
jgi:hypothetical protein